MRSERIWWVIRHLFKVDINEIDVDLSEYIEEDDNGRDMSDLHVKLDSFSAQCKPQVARFHDALQEMCAVIQGFHDSIPLAKVIPSGGAMRTQCLQEELLRAVRSLGWKKSSLTYTLNMDEPVALGAATMAHLLDRKCVKLDKSVVNSVLFGENSVDWSAFSTGSQDIEICMRENAMSWGESTGPKEELQTVDERKSRQIGGGIKTEAEFIQTIEMIHAKERDFFKISSLVNDLTGLLYNFEDSEAAGTLVFCQGRPLLDKTPQELIGEKTCFGKPIQWERLNSSKTRAARRWKYWSWMLSKYQKQLKEKEAEFVLVKEDVKQIRTNRMQRESVTVEKLEEMKRFLKTVEKDYSDTLNTLKWAIRRVNYMILKRAG